MKKNEDTWNEFIVSIIKKADKPLRRKDILKLIEDEGLNMPYENLSVYLFHAKKAGVISHIKIPPSKKGFYCNPEWVDDKGNLIIQFKPYWENELS